MSDNILKDTGERDSLIERTVESALNTAVVGSARMTGGEVNDTYKVETEDRAFVVKVFKRDWPEEGKSRGRGDDLIGRCYSSDASTGIAAREAQRLVEGIAAVRKRHG